MGLREREEIILGFDTIPACDGRTDGQTDKQTRCDPYILVTHASIASRGPAGKKCSKHSKVFGVYFGYMGHYGGKTRWAHFWKKISAT